MTGDTVKAQAREILNRHLEYTDGLSRGQVMTRTDCALAAVEEALNTRANTQPDPVEYIRQSMIEAAISGGGSYRRDIDCLAGNPEGIARAAIAAMGTIASSMGEIDALRELRDKFTYAVGLRSDCKFLLSVIDSCNEAGSPPCEMDPEDLATIEQIRGSINSQQTEGNGE